MLLLTYLLTYLQCDKVYTKKNKAQTVSQTHNSWAVGTLWLTMPVAYFWANIHQGTNKDATKVKRSANAAGLSEG